MSDLNDDTPLMAGSASPASGSNADENECPVATLWLSDPVSRSGWSMRHVWRKEEKKPERRAGFRK